MDLSTTLLLASGSGEDDDGEKKMQEELPEDDIVEILGRLPVKSLMRFKSVSKRWYSRILSPNFIAFHSKHNPSNHKEVTLQLCSLSCQPSSTDDNTHHAKTTLSFRFGESTDLQELTFSLNFSRVEMVGCLNGLVCLALFDPTRKYALWNPATRQSRLIDCVFMMDDDPDSALFSNHGSYGSGFCFDKVTNAHMVAYVQLTLSSEEGRETRAQVSVFSIASNSWTHKNVSVPYRISGSGFNIIRPTTCLNGYIHWHIATFRHHGPQLEDMYILSYSMNDGVFKRIEMPIHTVYDDYNFAAYKGSLAVFVYRGAVVVRTQTHSDKYYTEFDVWVMNDSGGPNQSWSKLLTCKPNIEVARALGFFRKDDVDLILLDKELDYSRYLYDPENGEIKKSRVTRPMGQTFLYSESLASLDQSDDRSLLMHRYSLEAAPVIVS